MIQIGDTIISLDIFEKKFCCDLAVCKGICCVEGDSGAPLEEGEAEQIWQEYLDKLAILISNLRMAYDMDIILGGEVGGYLADAMLPLGEKVMAYNGFDHDVRYLKICAYKREASAVGAAKYFLQRFIKEM